MGRVQPHQISQGDPTSNDRFHTSTCPRIPPAGGVGGRGQRRHLGAGLLAMCQWGIPLFLLGVAVDRLAFLPTPVRALILVLIAGVALVQAWRHGWRHLRRFDPARTALKIEDREGGLESLLVSAVQLGESDPPPGTSAALWEATRNRAEDRAQKLEPRKIVNFRSLRVPGLVALALAVVILVMGIVNGPFLVAGLKRIFTPWSTVAYPTKTKLDLGPGDLVVKEGERAEIGIRISGAVPKLARLSLQTGEGDPRGVGA